MNKYYKRDGTLYKDIMEWSKDLEKKEYKIVKQEILPNGKWVSTVWLGLDHSYRNGPPLIFETMVFPKEGDYGDLDMDRYSTEEEAIKGHKKMVKKWSKKEKTK